MPVVNGTDNFEHHDTASGSILHRDSRNARCADVDAVGVVFRRLAASEAMEEMKEMKTRICC